MPSTRQLTNNQAKGLSVKILIIFLYLYHNWIVMKCKSDHTNVNEKTLRINYNSF